MKKSTLITFIICSCLGLSAQTGIFIKGTVLDAVAKTPLPYVALFFEGSSHGDITNSGGQFTINTTSDVVQERRLKVMFTGYETQEIKFNEESNLNSIKIYLVPIAHKNDIALLEAVRIMGDEGRNPLPYYLYTITNLVQIGRASCRERV